MRLFLNPSTFGYLRGLAEEFDESTNAVRVELNRFEEANMLISAIEGNRKVYKANTMHPLFPEVQNILKKATGIDIITERIIADVGGLNEVYLTGRLAEGKQCDELELLIVGANINEAYLANLVTKAQKLMKREIITHVISEHEFLNWKSSRELKLILIYTH
jgi:hypothetical protein